MIEVDGYKGIISGKSRPCLKLLNSKSPASSWVSSNYNVFFSAIICDHLCHHTQSFFARGQPTSSLLAAGVISAGRGKGGALSSGLARMSAYTC
jgi:hypothetical protein